MGKRLDLFYMAIEGRMSTSMDRKCLSNSYIDSPNVTIFGDRAYWKVIKIQFSSVTQSCPTFCNAMECSTPSLPIYHHLPEFTQAHVH